jgi:hypothetical protein
MYILSYVVITLYLLQEIKNILKTYFSLSFSFSSALNTSDINTHRGQTVIMVPKMQLLSI